MDQSQWADPVESFAQTGPQEDDLFDDAVHEAESMRLRSDEDLFNDDFVPVPEPIVEPSAPIAVPAPPTAPAKTSAGANRGHGDGQQRSRGRGGRGRGQGAQNGGANGHAGRSAQPPAQNSNAPENAPTGPRKETTFAVRGDRQATGGVRKPKLTEEELTERMANMQILNASKTAAHERAEADKASFAEREQQAKQQADLKRKEERRDRQQMMGEREKNRLRKLKAMTGREWDAEKEEDDFSKGGKFDKRGSATAPGDKESYSDGREYMYHEPRGDRGRGRGSGRGGRGGRSQDAPVPKQEDFPALPSKSTTTKSSAPAKDGLPEAAGKSSWADQVESAT